jgi:hypothetical protein
VADVKALSESPNIIRSELNIEKFPLFTTSQFKGKSREYTREERTSLGEIQKRTVVIGKIAGNEIGILRILDLKCFYALVKMWEEAGKPYDENVSFSCHRIAKILGKSWSGRSYSQIKGSLERLRKIPIDWIRAFKNKGSDDTLKVLETFTILEDLKLVEREKGEVVVEAFSSFRFNKHLLSNLSSNYSKPVSLDTIFRFKRDISILLYLHLDLIMSKRTDYSRRLENLIVQDLDLGTTYQFPSYRKRIIQPALDELLGCRLSTGLLTKAVIERTSDGKDWKIICKKRPFSGDQLPSWKNNRGVINLVKEILSVTGDGHSEGFYIKIAGMAQENHMLFDLIHRSLSEVKVEAREGHILKSKGAAFTDKLKRFCENYNIDLKLTSGRM